MLICTCADCHCRQLFTCAIAINDPLLVKVDFLSVTNDRVIPLCYRNIDVSNAHSQIRCLVRRYYKRLLRSKYAYISESSPGS